jgi:hypothetical protein
MVLLELGDVDRTKVLNDESLILARELGEPWRVILSLRDRAVAALLQYDIGQAVDLAREAAMLSSDVEYGWVRASALRALAWAFLMGDGPEKPGMLFREALELERDGGSIRGVAESLEGLAAVASAQGQRDRTAQLDAAASTLRRSIHTPLRPSERLLRAASMRYANAAPGAEMLNPAVGEDEDAHIDAVIAAVLSQSNDRFPPVN